MICVIAGRIKAIGSDAIDLEDLASGDVYTARVDDTPLSSLKVGQTGVFMGDYSTRQLVVYRVNIRKFLNPLHEEELLEMSAMLPTIRVINDLYPEYFDKAMRGTIG